MVSKYYRLAQHVVSSSVVSFAIHVRMGDREMFGMSQSEHNSRFLKEVWQHFDIVESIGCKELAAIADSTVAGGILHAAAEPDLHAQSKRASDPASAGNTTVIYDNHTLLSEGGDHLITGGSRRASDVEAVSKSASKSSLSVVFVSDSVWLRHEGGTLHIPVHWLLIFCIV